MSGHTPGPWRYERSEEPGYCAHSYVWGPQVSIHCAGGNINGVEPDMLLIAAAPDMLAALVRARRALAFACEYKSVFEDEYELVDAVIKAATGGGE